jgi:TP901 family phage tail tape measure protein
MSNVSGQSGNAGSLNVNISIATTGAAQAAQQMRAVTNATGAMGKSVAASAIPIRTMGDALRQSASLIKYSVIGGFVNVGQEAIRMSRQFELSFSRIQGLVGESAMQIDMYKNTVLEMAAQTAKGPLELADALYFITSAGIKGSTALQVLEQSARSAAAGLGETTVVADALTSILNAYGESTYDAAYANDILVATVREGKAEADQFAPALGKVLPVAAAFGASFEDVSAGVAALTRTGASAGTSAIYLRQVLSQLLKPSKQASDAMKAVGTSGEDIRRRIQEDGLLTALEYLNRQLGGNDYQVAADGLSKVFGNVRALTAVFSLLGPNLEANRKIFEELNSAAGDANIAFETYAQTADAKFNTALASSQRALIGLGDAFMPVATAFVEIGGILAQFSAAIVETFSKAPIIGKATKLLLGTAAATIILSRGFLFVVTRGTALLRLFANMQYVLKGLTMGIRTQTSTTAGLNNMYRLLGMTTAQTAAMETALNNTFTNGATSQKLLLEAVAANTKSKVIQKLATNKANVAETALNITTRAQANAFLTASLGIQVYAYRLVTLIPSILGVLGVAFTLFTMFKSFFGKKDKMDGMEERKKSLTEVNQLLGENIKLAQTAITVSVDVDEMIDTKSITKQLEQELPQDIINAIENARNNLAGNLRGKTSVGAAIIQSMEFSSVKQKQQVVAALAAMLNIDADELMSALKPEQIGRDVSGVLASKIIVGFSEIDNEFTKKINSQGFDGARGALRAVFEEFAAQGEMTLAKNRKKVTDVLESIAQEIGQTFGETNDFGLFISAVEGASTQMELAGLSAEEQSLRMGQFTREIFQSIKGMNDLSKDSKSAANGIKSVFAAAENRGKLSALMSTFTGSEEDALAIIDKVNKELEKNPEADHAEQAKILIGVIDEFTEANKRNTESLDSQGRQIYDVANQFGKGLAPAIRALRDEYEAATDAMKNFESGQEAIFGTAVEFDDAQQDVRGSLRSLNDALRESGGAVDTSLAGDKTREAIKKYREDILGLANAYAVTPGLSEQDVKTGVTKIITAGATQILQSVKDAGGNLEEARKYLSDIQFNIGDQETLSNYVQTFFGEGGLDVSSLSDIEKIPAETLNAIGQAIPSIGEQAAKAAKPGTDSFNAAVKQQFLTFWGIKSPSKVAAEEIGQPIGEGVVIGIGEGLSVAVLRMIASGFKKRVVSAFSGIKVEVGNQLGEKIVASVKSGVETGATDVDGVIKGILDPDTTATGGSGGDGDPTGAAFKRGKQFGRFFKKGITTELAKSFLKQKSAIETPIIDLIEAVIGDASDALGTIGDYIDAQIEFQKALSENLKLANTQLGLQDALNKARRESERSTRRFGAQGGTEITDYEQAQIEELQKTFEKVSRDYSLRRASIADVIDAEEALNEARIAAGEVSSKIIESQNDVIDAEFNLKTAGLEASKSIYEIVDAQKNLTEAAINFKLNAEQAASVFQRFADQAFPGLEYRISMATGTIYKAGIALTDDNGLFQKSLRGLGQKIYDALALGVEEARAKSTVPEFVQPAKEPVPAPTAVTPRTPTQEAAIQFATVVGTSLFTSSLRNAMLMDLPMFAQGGLVTKPTLGIVGEAGPELIVPLNGLGVTTALQNMTPSRQPTSQAMSSSGQSFNIVVNNPVPETASDSISRRMRSLATAGLFG